MHAGGVKECEPISNGEKPAGMVDEESEHKSSLSEKDIHSRTESCEHDEDEDRGDWDVRSVPQDRENDGEDCGVPHLEHFYERVYAEVGAIISVVPIREPHHDGV